MGVLVTAIASIEKTYFDVLETGLLSPSDVYMAEMLHTLQITVSEIREASLRNSLSLHSTFRECLNGHTFTILHCIREVWMLETHIEKPSSAKTPSTHSRIAHVRFLFAVVTIPRVPIFKNAP
ncbi:hypothetical protein B0H13DRAFT_2322324 [Mycena leptocephala]|nr:hypothetical protein B0H13DRAFT_2322324 [Mycena leptocephala]